MVLKRNYLYDNGISNYSGGSTIRVTKITVPDENDYRVAEALESLGIKRNLALLLTYLRVVNWCSSREIEVSTGLRQPEVSIAMRTLRENGWIDEREIKREGKGRPTKVYALRQSMDEIIKYYENQKIQESDHIMHAISKLKTLSSA